MNDQIYYCVIGRQVLFPKGISDKEFVLFLIEITSPKQKRALVNIFEDYIVKIEMDSAIREEMVRLMEITRSLK